MATISTVTHPLDPLTGDEQRAVCAALREAKGLDDRHLFVMVQLVEPPKEVVRTFAPGQRIDRAARVSIWDRERGEIHEAVVSVDGEVRSFTHVPGAQPRMMVPEIEAVPGIVLADERFLAGLAARGVDPADVYMETWPFGGLVPERYAGRRLIWTPLWEQRGEDDNMYAHPIRGLHAVVDVRTLEVLEVEDHGVTPVPQARGDYRAAQLPSIRGDLRPLEIMQPDGPSFTLDGWQVRWQKWSLRLGWCPREGLVVHDLRYDDDGRERRIAHRLSIAELVIPYGDASPGGYRKNAFDVGEIGVGYFANSLALGCDCLGEIRYLDVEMALPNGEIQRIENAICLHEEDHGVLWKHTSPDGHVEVRRSRRFTASFICTVDNYEYGYYWHFYEDGTIEFEAKLTGIVLTFGVDPQSPSPHGTVVAPGVLAPYHQHIFCARLDLDIDGEANSVVEVESYAEDVGPENPWGGAYVTRETVLPSESAAQREIDPRTGRYWKVVNPSRQNQAGGRVGYKLIPGATTFALAHRDSHIGRRATFMYNHLWVTPFAPDERYPAGEYPFQHPGGAGLPEWTAADRSLVETDVVLWHTFGTNHIPRVEDWPVMPVERTGFHLKPVGFFDRSPALDVAPPHRCAH